MIAARSFAYVVELIVSLDVPIVYPFSPLCSHLSKSSRNMYCASLYWYRFCPSEVFTAEYGIGV